MPRTFLLAGAAILATTLAAGVESAAAVRATHSVTVTGELVDHWTINENEECGMIGSGTTTVRFKGRAPRAFPYIDKYQRNGKGSWIVGIPFGYKGSLIKDLPAFKGTGTYTLVDNTTLRPYADGTPCKPRRKIGCGTFPLRINERRAGTLIGVERYDRRNIAVSAGTGDAFGTKDIDGCHGGELFGWSDHRLSKAGDLLVKMPSPRALKRRRSISLPASHHKKIVSIDSLQPEKGSATDDVTRRVTVTFKKR